MIFTPHSARRLGTSSARFLVAMLFFEGCAVRDRSIREICDRLMATVAQVGRCDQFQMAGHAYRSPTLTGRIR
jgi:hypothetical protein